METLEQSAKSSVTFHLKNRRQTHAPAVILLTGLRGSGKTTVALTVAEALHEAGYRINVLDEADLQSGLCSDLGDSPQDWEENARRIAEVVKLFFDSGSVVLVPSRALTSRERYLIKKGIPSESFYEVYCKAPKSVCSKRSSPLALVPQRGGIYEEPEKPTLVLDTHTKSPPASANDVITLLKVKGVEAFTNHFREASWTSQ